MVFPTESGSVEGLAVHPKYSLQGGRPSVFDKVEVTLLIRAVDLVSNDGETRVRGVDADLMHATGFGIAADHGEAFPIPPFEASFYFESCP